MYNVFAHAIENVGFFIIRVTDTKMQRLLGTDLLKEEVFDIKVTRYLTRSH
ncbi:MAG: hypothetical protein HFI58_01515 [Lachnospiraceae bacterium]|nr:hypothetical protein [uncultured Acetatifactor sp.]MCI9253506.1 hypothetical protein [Lachnospiraceae bacterium]